MPNTLSRNLKQTITHWVATPDGFGGFAFATPVTQKGRWEDRQIQFREPSGNELTSTAIVYLTSDVAVGDYLCLGDQTLTADPTTLAAAARIQQFNSIPDLRALQNQRKAFM
jgi:hypothetical protein